jgi:hypothetical protein
MPRIVELTIVVFALLVALIAVGIGSGYVPELSRALSAALDGRPWQAGEVARLLASAAGPTLLGALVCVGLIAYLVSSHRLRRRMAAFPDQPWRWRADWAAGRVRLSNRAPAVGLAIATLLYGFVVCPLGVYLASLKNPVAVYAFVAALGAFLALFAGMQWVNRRRNRAELHLETLPGRIGGPWVGLTTIPEPFPDDTRFRLRLRCEVTQSHPAGSGNTDDAVSVLTDTRNARRRSHTQTSTVFEDTQVVAAAEGGSALRCTRVRASFDVPAGLPPPRGSSSRTARPTGSTESRVTIDGAWASGATARATCARSSSRCRSSARLDECLSEGDRSPGGGGPTMNAHILRPRAGSRSMPNPFAP